MTGHHLQVISKLTSWLSAGHPCWLATVTATYGSSPRPVGSMLAWCAEHGHIGSLSGGCVEQDLLQRLPQLPPVRAPLRQRFGVTEAEQQRYRLPCGGQLEILLEAVDGDDVAHFQALQQALQQRRPCARSVAEDGQRRLLPAEHSKTGNTAEGWQQLFKPDYQLLLAGAGETSAELAKLAQPAGFDVTICDFRDEFLHGFKVAGARVVKAMPDELVREQFHDAHSAVIGLAHDPRVDDLAVIEALDSQAFYVGAMGSQQTSAKRRQRLAELGLHSDQLARLHAPVGLAINSHTPYHIAISVLAHLLQQR
ncbi:hypothetical protein GCM10011297_19860 [Bacterioplanes sanyensis]|uniref:XdhC family protein n=1 Tax=Bacterioplanes sanyensis TaxID=1249553 RepID=UPI0016733C82|nr:XdhC family protein [Bacterioplanes sanyensis]GGY46947.1 hypothetical protein GCM10011297_19860 [Bacterioplanes sanyensis]